ncbi:hypothetical protein VRRI112168_02515 [Vreelandella rituensis]|uniref:N-acetyltransferase domain-containing protein n=1 Tax=Vreelandella rituensis TaxID=2282306 RepID=A0A368UAS6_9GAMM|nr:hypothetical protein [Halomonas rituensis]RCV93617.1 hypothetical protein DU506_00235 [Halomonas rituensis]
MKIMPETWESKPERIDPASPLGKVDAMLQALVARESACLEAMEMHEHSGGRSVEAKGVRLFGAVTLNFSYSDEDGMASLKLHVIKVDEDKRRQGYGNLGLKAFLAAADALDLPVCLFAERWGLVGPGRNILSKWYRGHGFVDVPDWLRRPSPGELKAVAPEHDRPRASFGPSPLL